jgi:hypothetical protein
LQEEEVIQDNSSCSGNHKQNVTKFAEVVALQLLQGLQSSAQPMQASTWPVSPKTRVERSIAEQMLYLS